MIPEFSDQKEGLERARAGGAEEIWGRLTLMKWGNRNSDFRGLLMGSGMGWDGIEDTVFPSKVWRRILSLYDIDVVSAMCDQSL